MKRLAITAAVAVVLLYGCTSPRGGGGSPSPGGGGGSPGAGTDPGNGGYCTLSSSSSPYFIKSVVNQQSYDETPLGIFPGSIVLFSTIDDGSGNGDGLLMLSLDGNADSISAKKRICIGSSCSNDYLIDVINEGSNFLVLGLESDVDSCRRPFILNLNATGGLNWGYKINDASGCIPSNTPKALSMRVVNGRISFAIPTPSGGGYVFSGKTDGSTWTITEFSTGTMSVTYGIYNFSDFKYTIGLSDGASISLLRAAAGFGSITLQSAVGIAHNLGDLEIIKVVEVLDPSSTSGISSFIILADYRDSSKQGFLVLKLPYDLSTLEWKKLVLPTASSSFIRSKDMILTDDGGILVVANIPAVDGTPLIYNILALKLDSSGNFQWSRAYSVCGPESPSGEVFRVSEDVAQNSYLIAGNTLTPPGDGRDLWLLRVSRTDGSVKGTTGNCGIEHDYNVQISDPRGSLTVDGYIPPSGWSASAISTDTTSLSSYFNSAEYSQELELFSMCSP